MLSARILEKEKVEIEKVAIPSPGVGEVQLKISHVGICGSDVHIYSGGRKVDYPMVMGHEGVGYVSQLGAGVKHLSLGQRVVIEPNFPCGQCEFCQQGRGNICPEKRSIGVTEAGCLSEYAVIPADFAWPVPDELSAEQVVLIEPTAVGVHALKVSRVQPGGTIAIIGLGAIGMLLAMLSIRLGYRVLAIDRDEDKCNKAAGFGTIICDANDRTQLIEQMEAEAVQAIFECGGSAVTASIATEIAPRGSNIILVGLAQTPAEFTPLNLTRKGVSIIPSMIYDHPSDFRNTIELMNNNMIDPNIIISGRYPLADAEQALSRAHQGQDTKLIIDITGV